MRRSEMARLLPGVYQLALEPLQAGNGAGLGQDTRLAAALDAMGIPVRPGDR